MVDQRRKRQDVVMTLVIMGVVLTMGLLLTIAYVADASEAMGIINALFFPVVLGLTLVWVIVRRRSG